MYLPSVLGVNKLQNGAGAFHDLGADLQDLPFNA